MTHVASVMCAQAKVNHANHTDDLDRVSPGRYRLRNPDEARRLLSYSEPEAAPAPPVWESAPAAAPQAEAPDEPPALPTGEGAPATPGKEWFWEGNVQAALIRHLEAEGWRIVQSANTAAGEHGVDVLAVRGDQTLAVEVKGFPSRNYARGARAGQPSRTSPTVQAGFWFAGVLHSAAKRLRTHPNAQVAICLPDFPRYRRLVEQCEVALERLGVHTLIVCQDGSVQKVP